MGAKGQGNESPPVASSGYWVEAGRRDLRIGLAVDARTPVPAEVAGRTPHEGIVVAKHLLRRLGRFAVAPFAQVALAQDGARVFGEGDGVI